MWQVQRARYASLVRIVAFIVRFLLISIPISSHFHYGFNFARVWAEQYCY